MKTYLKTLARMFQKHIMRFLSIIFIVVVSVGLISGVGSSGEVIRRSLAESYRDQNISDLIVKSTGEAGFSDEQLSLVRERYGKDNVSSGNSLDVEVEVNGKKSTVRLYFLEDSGVNELAAREFAPSDDTAYDAAADDAADTAE